ncbi:MAG: M48 family metalloprotease, partial [Legionellales bacterium]
MTIEVPIYTPRDNKELIEDLKKGLIPLELKEQLEIADTPPEAIKEKIASIIQRIIEKNNLKDKIIAPIIQISAGNTENASMISLSSKPLLTLNKGLLQNVQTEDELAGVIAHELGHLLLNNQCTGTDHHDTKINEVAADNLGLKLLCGAEYDPQGIIYFLKRTGGSESHLITIEDISTAESLKKAADLAQRIMDPHPQEESRIRAMEIHITHLKQQGTIASNAPVQPTLLPQEFKSAVHAITYQSPLEQGLETIRYETLSTLEKLEVLTWLMDKVYPPTNRAAAERYAAITKHIAVLKVDFKDPPQAKAFNELADLSMGYKELSLNEQATFPRGSKNNFLFTPFN